MAEVCPLLATSLKYSVFLSIRLLCGCLYKCRNPYRQASCLSINFWERVMQSLGGQEKRLDAATKVEERVRRQEWRLYTERTFGLERDGCALIPDKETK